MTRWVACWVIVHSGCCSHAAYDAAVERARQLETAVVPDRDPIATPASECGDVAHVDLLDVVHRRHEKDLVAIDAEPVRDAIMTCTQKLCVDACDRPTPCCNACEGRYRLVAPEGAPVHVTLAGGGLRCGGPSCAVDCAPFGPRPRRTYRFVGRYTVLDEVDGFVRARFDVERWCGAPMP